MRLLALLRVVLGLGLLVGVGVATTLPAAGAAPNAAGLDFVPLGPSLSQPAFCAGTDAHPGQLAGSYPNGVVIWGTCWVNGGVANVQGAVTIEPGSFLNASFARNDQNHGVGISALYVTGNIVVDSGGTLVLGCEAHHSPCTDDPASATGGTLSTLDIVSGDVVGSGALGMVIHHSLIGGNVTQLGGGGGVTCAPSGVFASELQSPVFSDLEDNWIVGDVTIAGLRTCWNGALRNYVGGDFTSAGNVFADPDANEVLSNVIGGNLACAGNSPVVEYGDSHASPDRVSGNASGECSFSTYQPNPAPSGPLMPIALSG